MGGLRTRKYPSLKVGGGGGKSREGGCFFLGGRGVKVGRGLFIGGLGVFCGWGGVVGCYFLVRSFQCLKFLCLGFL